MCSRPAGRRIPRLAMKLPADLASASRSRGPCACSRKAFAVGELRKRARQCVDDHRPYPCAAPDSWVRVVGLDARVPLAGSRRGRPRTGGQGELWLTAVDAVGLSRRRRQGLGSADRRLVGEDSPGGWGLAPTIGERAHPAPCGDHRPVQALTKGEEQHRTRCRVARGDDPTSGRRRAVVGVAEFGLRGRALRTNRAGRRIVAHVGHQVDVDRRRRGDAVVLAVVAGDGLDEDLFGDAQAGLAHALEEFLRRQDLAARDAGQIGDQAFDLVDRVAVEEVARDLVVAVVGGHAEKELSGPLGSSGAGRAAGPGRWCARVRLSVRQVARKAGCIVRVAGNAGKAGRALNGGSRLLTAAAGSPGSGELTGSPSRTRKTTVPAPS